MKKEILKSEQTSRPEEEKFDTIETLPPADTAIRRFIDRNELEKLADLPEIKELKVRMLEIEETSQQILKEVKSHRVGLHLGIHLVAAALAALAGLGFAHVKEGLAGRYPVGIETQTKGAEYTEDFQLVGP